MTTAATRFCAGCGRPAARATTRAAAAPAAIDPPRFCTGCGRKLEVQVLPDGLHARVAASAARALDPLDELRRAGLFRELRTIESAQGPRVRLDGREVLLLCSNDYLGLAGRSRGARRRGGGRGREWGAGRRRLAAGLGPHGAAP